MKTIQKTSLKLMTGMIFMAGLFILSTALSSSDKLEEANIAEEREEKPSTTW